MFQGVGTEVRCLQVQVGEMKRQLEQASYIVGPIVDGPEMGLKLGWSFKGMG